MDRDAISGGASLRGSHPTVSRSPQITIAPISNPVMISYSYPANEKQIRRIFRSVGQGPACKDLGRWKSERPEDLHGVREQEGTFDEFRRAKPHQYEIAPRISHQFRRRESSRLSCVQCQLSPLQTTFSLNFKVPQNPDLRMRLRHSHNGWNLGSFECQGC